jgi:hypothetical protein
METGIADFFAAQGPELGIVFEYIECRSRTCEIAGYFVAGREGTGGYFYKVTEQPWWQGGTATSSNGFDINGTEYFVTIYYDGQRYSQ